jgi:OHCU decarboxylase
MDRDTFLMRFAALYEHSPWVAERAWAAGIDERHDDPVALHAAFRQVVLEAGAQRQLELLRAHPQLAARQAPDTADSRAEQMGAGLDACSEAEWQAFRSMNDAYLERHGFPFIVAVKGLDRQEILLRLRRRLSRTTDVEFDTALEEVCRIGWYRLQDRQAPAA